MPYFYFINSSSKLMEEFYPQINLLHSFIENFYTNTGGVKKPSKRDIERLIKPKRLLIDSGVFVLRSNPKLMEIVPLEKYVLWYINFLKIVKELPNFVGYFEVDLYKAWGEEKVRRIREMIEDKVGIRAIPVWQADVTFDMEYPYKLIEEYKYDYIGIPTPKRRFIRNELVRNSLKLQIAKITNDLYQKYKTKIHLLGLQFNDSFFYSYKIYSFDNSNAADFTCSRQTLYIFDGEKLKAINPHMKKKKVKYKDYKETLLFTLKNLIHFANKLEEQENEGFNRQDNNI